MGAFINNIAGRVQCSAQANIGWVIGGGVRMWREDVEGDAVHSLGQRGGQDGHPPWPLYPVFPVSGFLDVLAGTHRLLHWAFVPVLQFTPFLGSLPVGVTGGPKFFEMNLEPRNGI